MTFSCFVQPRWSVLLAAAVAAVLTSHMVHAEKTSSSSSSNACPHAEKLAKTYVKTAAFAQAETKATVKLAVSARAVANAMLWSSARVLADVTASATVAMVGSQCVVGKSGAAVKSVADAYAKAEARARAAAEAYAQAWASSRAASRAMARAKAVACLCGKGSDALRKQLAKGDKSMSKAVSSISEYEKAMASCEDQMHKAAKIMVKVSNHAYEVAKPQCLACNKSSASPAPMPSSSSGMR